MEYSILFIGAFIAEIMGTISGFGSSSIFLPIAHQIFQYETALILVAIYHIFGNTSRFSLFWKHWDKKIFFLFGIPSIFATVLGVQLVGIISSDILKMILGIILIIFALYSFLKPRFKIQANMYTGIIGGASSGFTAGLIGTGGVLRGAFITAFGLKKEAYIATIASIALLVDFTRIPIYFHKGFLPEEFFLYVIILFFIAFAGSYIGKKIIKHIDSNILRKIILIMIMIMSSILIMQGYSNYFL
ncbi:sulfite exporter TauE/SafE family protein [Candidatus Gracilibacteria bacterium]|nr:sulfite exporter TauE/SafE family protein [Candidatus Gracilibacteria bacterium]